METKANADTQAQEPALALQTEAGPSTVKAKRIRTPGPGYDYYRRAFSGHRMPFAYVDLDLLDQNIREVVARVSGKQVRLASKSIRSVAVLRRILAADTCFQGIMC
ncbi:MAG: hypothetical protein ACXVA4_09090, partial [Ktedonobacterales bacterium]